MLFINVLLNAKICGLLGLDEMDIEHETFANNLVITFESRASDDRLYIS